MIVVGDMQMLHVHEQAVIIYPVDYYYTAFIVYVIILLDNLIHFGLPGLYRY